MLIFPFYSLAQVLIMPPIGAIYDVILATRRQFLGRYGFGHRRPPRHPAHPRSEAGLTTT